jgi:hypothetical protein
MNAALKGAGNTITISMKIYSYGLLMTSKIRWTLRGLIQMRIIIEF